MSWWKKKEMFWYKLVQTKLTFCLLLVCSFSFDAYSLHTKAHHSGKVSLKFNRLSSDDGLSDNRIISIIQDKTGFLWVGTADGLNRYDGYSFKQFRHNPDKADGLSGAVIYDIVEDKQGMLWIATNLGLNRFSPETEQFKVYLHDKNNPNSLSHDKVTSIHEDKFGMLWIGTEGGGINWLNPVTDEIKSYRHQPRNPESLASDIVYDIIEDPQGFLWIGTSESGLSRLDPESGKFTYYPRPTEDAITKLVRDEEGIIWVGTTSTGLHQFNPKSGEFSNELTRDVPNYFIKSLFIDNHKNILYGTLGGGMTYLSHQTREVFRYQYDESDQKSLNNNIVRAIYQDRQGVIWVGTEAGLNRIVPSGEKFNHFRKNINESNSLSSNFVRSIYEDQNGTVWVGTFDGLNRYDPEQGIFHHYFSDVEPQDSVGANSISTISEDSNGDLWFGNYRHGLSRYDRQADRFEHYRNDKNNPNSLSDDGVMVLYKDLQGDLWVGTTSGVNKILDRQQGFKRNFEGAPALASNSVFDILQDRRGNFWFGTQDGGLIRFDPRLKKSESYRYDKNTPGSLSANRVIVIHQDKKSRIWVGTHGGGLNLFDEKEKKFTQYRETDGLPSNVISGILEDEEGNLWISTNRGISRFNPELVSFKNFTEEDGLQGNEFFQGAYFKSRSGEMFFGGSNGFNRFFPQQVISNERAPSLAFTDFRIFNQSVPVINQEVIEAAEGVSAGNGRDNANHDSEGQRVILTKAIHATQQITLTHEEKLFSVEFAALHFISPGRNQYAYKLEGWDQDWIYTNYKNRNAVYTNIPAGDYTLRVKAANKSGIWNEQGISLDIKILPPWWFYEEMKLAYMVLGILLLTFVFYRLTILPNKRAAALEIQIKSRTDEIKQKSDYIHQLHQLNLQFSQNISHSLKTPLNLILGPIDRLLEQKVVSRAELHRVKRNALRLQKDVDSLVSFSLSLDADLSGKVVCDVTTIAQELVEDFERVFISKKLKLSVNIEHGLEILAEPEAFERVLINLLENAIKYTPADGEVSVKVRHLGNKVLLEVSDSGIGIPEKSQQLIFERGVRLDAALDQQGTGVGLALVKEIVQRNDGGIAVSSKVNEGSKFVVLLPKPEAEYVALDGIKGAMSANTKNQVSTITKLTESLDKMNWSFHDLKNGKLEKNKANDGQPKLLIVEDDRDMSAFILESFSKSYSCFQAYNGQDGLSLARELLPDLIISDVMMPKMSGQKMLKELKADPRISHIPVILVTAAGDQQAQDKAIAAGAIHYFNKPFNEYDIEKAVNEALDIQSFAKAKVEQYLIENKAISQSEFPFFEQKDIKLMNEFGELIQSDYKDPKFTNPVADLASRVYMEQRRVRRKLDSFLSHTPALVLRRLRLEKGRLLIEQGLKSGVVFQNIGFSSQEYFIRCFKSEYGQSPSQYYKEYRKNTVTTEIDSSDTNVVG
ncbi:hybrid sensor histidine kinase/response regulator transcription factor [Aliikangiella coralliicola]|uniref:histidine kinase n=1 Tax=Aliikangiella coralliicola TaxID=2592383 RepID=A0A545UIQ6_9GAMM|nr:two-component regulator propeller domain-containing protein [Aliikangiella coralliicola]TQV89345.1 response regulator [Aliikangiella coralliicola]